MSQFNPSPEDSARAYQAYLEGEWAKNEFYSAGSNNDPYSWGESWIGESFSQWLDTELVGGEHKSQYA